MSDNSTIEWTDATWNPVTGCTEVSPGCDHCYAKTFAERFRGTPGHYFERGFDVQLRSDKLNLPLTWRKPKRIFVNSMSDLFHQAVTDEYIAKVFATMALAPQHTFQVLTKRHGRMRTLISWSKFRQMVATFASDLVGEPPFEPCPEFHRVFDSWPLPNVWLGVTAENQKWFDIRYDALADTPAAVRFVSLEPLLGPINLPEHFPWHYTEFGVLCACGAAMRNEVCPRQIDWVIVGGESGREARPMHPEWARSLRDQCTDAGVPFLFKQWGEYAPGIHPTGSRSGTVGHGFYSGPVVAGRFTGEYATMSRIGKKAAGRELDGRTWDEYPAVVSHA